MRVGRNSWNEIPERQMPQAGFDQNIQDSAWL